MILADYHVHTHFSADSDASLPDYLSQAKSRGLGEICFTDHFDLAFVSPDPSISNRDWECDVAAVFAAIDALPGCKGVDVKKGVEMGVRTDLGIIERTQAHLQSFPFDFVLASVHMVDGVDPYFPSYFNQKTRQEGFVRYLQTVHDCLRQTEFYSAVGHIDYPSKGCPHEDNALRYADASDLLDALFRHVIERGKCIELNTSILKKLHSPTQDLAIFQRYAELGGEYVTIGSDAHSCDGLAYRFDDALEFLRTAGIMHIATFDQMKPVLQRI